MEITNQWVYPTGLGVKLQPDVDSLILGSSTTSKKTSARKLSSTHVANLARASAWAFSFLEICWMSKLRKALIRSIFDKYFIFSFQASYSSYTWSMMSCKSLQTFKYWLSNSLDILRPVIRTSYLVSLLVEENLKRWAYQKMSWGWQELILPSSH